MPEKWIALEDNLGKTGSEYKSVTDSCNHTNNKGLLISHMLEKEF